MKVSQAITTLSFIVGAAAASTGLPIVDMYKTLLDRCNAAGDNTGATGYVDYAYGQCYPYEVNGDLAQQAVFCKSVTCTSNPNPDCTGGATPPVGIPVPALLTLVNVADFVQLLGQGAKCWPNGLLV